ncbi:MAG: hypothetical protein MUO21_06315, partial [Nitrososphaeraceae archaeon]|nr:hypothetical protein [Nitrososphaeraceae archaeon]
MAGMIIAALPFAFHFGIFSKEIEATKEVKEILVFIILITICIVLFLFIESSFSKNEWLSSVFHVISASTTTGFQFIDCDGFRLSYWIVRGHNRYIVGVSNLPPSRSKHRRKRRNSNSCSNGAQSCTRRNWGKRIQARAQKRSRSRINERTD